jgi:hypothetical protein
MFGLEKRGNPRALARLVHGLLERIAVMPWNTPAADHFLGLWAPQFAAGKGPGPPAPGPPEASAQIRTCQPVPDIA